jgi:hypothetical protein
MTKRQRLRKFLDFIKKDTKLFLQFTKKHYVFVVFTILIPIILTLSYVKIMQSLPGDVLFPLRNYYETTFVSQESNNINAISNGESLIRHRVKGINSLHQNNKCIQLILVEEDFSNILQLQIINILQNSNSQEEIEDLSVIITQNSYEVTCEDSSINPYHLELFTKLLSSKLDMNSDWYTQEIDKFEHTYDDLVEQMRSHNFENQLSIDNANSVMDSLRDNLDDSHDFVRAGDGLQATLKLESVKQEIEIVELLLSNQKVNGSSWLDTQKVVCTVMSELLSCQQQEFESKYNSINASNDLSEKVELGESWMYETILELFATYYN